MRHLNVVFVYAKLPEFLVRDLGFHPPKHSRNSAESLQTNFSST